MQLEIPVKPHVKTFLEHPLNLGKGVADIRSDHWLGELLLCVLSFHPLDRDDLGVDYLPKLTARHASIVINPTFKLNYEMLTDRHLMRIGLGLEAWFKNSLICYVRGRMSLMQSEQGAVKAFYREYGLSDEEYDFDAAYKVSQRSRAHL